MNNILKEKITEAFSSVLPISAIVLIASVALTTMAPGTVLIFMGGTALLVLGMGFFTLGVDMAMIPMGEGIGVQLTKSSKLGLILIISFVMGVIITIAEPNLRVLAKQISAIPAIFLIGTVSAGVGFFMLLAVLRTFLKIRLSILLIISYVAAFSISYWTPYHFIPVSFEAGGIATGPIVVPFILSLGMGLASVRSDKDSQDDSFGLVSLVAIGPIIAMLFLGIFYHPAGLEAGITTVHEVTSSREVVETFAVELPSYLKDVLMAMGAIIVCFIIFEIVSRRYKRHQLFRIAVGFFYAVIGLMFFLTGANVGFIPVGQLLGLQIASSEIKWVLIPFGALVGYYIVAAEPSVHVLTKQVEEISSGSITAKTMKRGLAAGMAIALTITMTRILLGIPLIWILIPGYSIALILSFFVPRIFTGIAFDSGAVCSGPMSAAFLLPLAMGACDGAGRDILTYAFGIVAIVAMTPLVVIQIMGLIFQFGAKRASKITGMHNFYPGETAGNGNDFYDFGDIIVFGENSGENSTNGSEK